MFNLQQFWQFITTSEDNAVDGGYYDIRICCSDAVFLTNKCFAWTFGLNFLTYSGKI